jgi:ubiquinone/menaquinone biosynthesis C-methylase UbiE
MGTGFHGGAGTRTTSWVCALVGAAIAIGILMRWGVSWWTLTLTVIVLGCPAAAVYVWWLSQRMAASVDATAPSTQGITMGWAAPIYEAYCPLLGLGTGFRRATLRQAGLKQGEQVLDVGCGTGVLTRRAADAVGPAGAVLGIDPAPAMIAAAQRYAARDGSDASFRVAAIENLPIVSGRFDVVLSSAMLHHLPPKTKLQGLQEVYRVLKDGGRLIVVDVDRPATLWWLVVWPLLFMPSVVPNLRGEIPEYLERAGFKMIEARGRWGGLLSFWVAYKEGRPP